MEHIAGRVGATERARGRAQAEGSVVFDWVMVILGSLFLAGLHIDGWAHSHGKVDQSFFTPWHAIFYSGFLLLAGALGGVIARNRLHGYSWARSTPRGYEYALPGAVIFSAGGLSDMIWHTLFGVEQNIEALISPSHLVLGFGMFLLLSAPFRAAWQRPDDLTDQGLVARLPMLLSLGLSLTLLAFITQFSHPFVELLASESARDSVTRAINSILLQTAVLMGPLCLAMRRWTLPFGAMTLIFSLSTFFATIVHDQVRLTLPVIAAGLLVDMLVRFLKPSPARPTAFRLVAFGAPVVLYLLYFLALRLSGGIAWSIHVWGGAIALAGIVGLLLSYLVLPPPAGGNIASTTTGE